MKVEIKSGMELLEIRIQSVWERHFKIFLKKNPCHCI